MGENGGGAGRLVRASLFSWQLNDDCTAPESSDFPIFNRTASRRKLRGLPFERPAGGADAKMSPRRFLQILVSSPPKQLPTPVACRVKRAVHFERFDDPLPKPLLDGAALRLGDRAEGNWRSVWPRAGRGRRPGPARDRPAAQRASRRARALQQGKGCAKSNRSGVWARRQELNL